MRLPKNHIDYMAFVVYKALKDNARVEVSNADGVIGIVRQELNNNLKQEEELRREAERLLEPHRQQILQSGADYRKMVSEGMRKLARDRGFTL